MLLRLARGEHHLGGVDHDDVVAGVDVGGERRLVLAPQERGHLGGQPAEDQAVGVDDAPGAGDVGRLGGERAHEKSLSRWCWAGDAGCAAPAGAGPRLLAMRTTLRADHSAPRLRRPTRRLPRIRRNRLAQASRWGLVADLHQGQALGRGGLGACWSVADRRIHSMSEGRFRPRPTSTRVPTSGPDHLVAEGVGLDLEGQQAAQRRDQAGASRRRARPAAGRSRPRPLSRSIGQHPPGDRVVRARCPEPGGRRPGSRARRAGRRPRRPWRAGRAGRPRARPAPASSGSATGAFDDQVAVAAGRAERRASKPAGATSAPRTTMAGPNWLLHERTTARVEAVDRSTGTSKWTTWPRACTPASVRPAQVSDDRRPGAPGRGPGQRPGHRALARLGGEAVEARAVVGDRHRRTVGRVGLGWGAVDLSAARPEPVPSSAVGPASTRRRPPGPGGGLTPVRCGPSGRCRPAGCPA